MEYPNGIPNLLKHIPVVTFITVRISCMVHSHSIVITYLLTDRISSVLFTIDDDDNNDGSDVHPVEKSVYDVTTQSRKRTTMSALLH